MSEPADLARLAALVAEPARARMLTALLGGIALTATELAAAADVAASTASEHLARLVDGGLLTIERQGRHRYFRIAGAEVAALLESLGSVATVRRPRVGPIDPALRAARVCYDHLAGERGVWLLDRLRALGHLGGPDGITVSASGAHFFARVDIDVEALARSRRAFSRLCLDWSERRHHLGGALGAAVLERILARGWVHREPDGRALAVTPAGERSLERLVGPRATTVSR